MLYTAVIRPKSTITASFVSLAFDDYLLNETNSSLRGTHDGVHGAQSDLRAHQLQRIDQLPGMCAKASLRQINATFLRSRCCELGTYRARRMPVSAACYHGTPRVRDDI
eukprot:1172509-Pyramimonas_sp.AAC.2